MGFGSYDESEQENQEYDTDFEDENGDGVNYPTLLALTRSLRVGLPDSATRFFTDARHVPTIRAGSAVSAGVDSE